MLSRSWLLTLPALLAVPIPLSESASGPSTPRAQEIRYFPAADPFFEQWAGSQLAAMHEPLLSVTGAVQGYRARYRLLVLPSFAPGYAVRIDAAADGHPVATVTVLDGAGGYAPGKPKLVTHPDVAAEAVAALSRQFPKLRFGDRAFDLFHKGADRADSYDTDEFGERIPPDKAAPLCCDGTQFVIEKLDEQGYHAITRHQCQLNEDTRSLVIALFGLGGIKPDRSEVGP